ncbi:hypothetical protein XENTR_v10008306 [Xenopus tropicalis]|nr:hypothetical protein XENTR_v10008306 [Xenopus tropicalis]
MLCAANLKQMSIIGVKSKGYCRIPKKQLNCDIYKIMPDDYTMCGNDYKPVCGTDGESYDNECWLCAVRLQQNTSIDIKYGGPCDIPGYKVDCSMFKPDDVKKPCTEDFNQLCGIDGVTYSNKCELCHAALKNKTDISVKHKGSCSVKGKRIDCSRYTEFCTFIYKPYCGSNGMSYSNKCSYCIAQNKNPELRFLFQGDCYP